MHSRVSTFMIFLTSKWTVIIITIIIIIIRLLSNLYTDGLCNTGIILVNLSQSSFTGNITKTRLFKYIENFTSKNWKYSDKNLWYFSYFC